MRRFGIALLSLFGVAIVVGFVVLLVAVFAVRGSLPPLDGERTVTGLRGPASLERDSLGIAVIEAGDWADAQFVLGFAHGQDRFFQMDLARRFMAGTLSELVGPGALDQDEALHDYGYADAARLHLAGLSASHRAALDAYVRGVNAGRRSLGRRPPEYLLLRHRPAPWTAEDSLLVQLYFYYSLSVHYRAEARHLELFRVLPEPVAAFLTLETSRFDQPLPALAGGSPTGGYTPAPIPPPWVLDLRGPRGPRRRGAGRGPLGHPHSRRPARGLQRLGHRGRGGRSPRGGRPAHGHLGARPLVPGGAARPGHGRARGLHPRHPGDSRGHVGPRGLEPHRRAGGPDRPDRAHPRPRRSLALPGTRGLRSLSHRRGHPPGPVGCLAGGGAARDPLGPVVATTSGGSRSRSVRRPGMGAGSPWPTSTWGVRAPCRK
jgi:hypothetical protein